MTTGAIAALAWIVLMGGAREDPPPPADLEPRLAGAWREEGVDEPRLLFFEANRCVLVWRGQQSLFDVEYGVDAIKRRPVGTGAELDEAVSIDGDRLTLRYPGGNEFTYVHLAEVPADARIGPMELGSRTPDDDELGAIEADLSARAERDQDVRQRLNALMTAARAAGDLDTAEGRNRFMTGAEMTAISREMASIDVENTRFLAKLLADVGWIDPDRFGVDANRNAFLIVQHSGNLRLMQTVLPRLEEEARANSTIGELYALLYDRTQLRLGGMQRYGTQLTSDATGGLVVDHLEDPENVDERRASVGMGPLETYLDYFRRDGRTVRVPGRDDD